MIRYRLSPLVFIFISVVPLWKSESWTSVILILGLDSLIICMLYFSFLLFLSSNMIGSVDVYWFSDSLLFLAITVPLMLMNSCNEDSLLTSIISLIWIEVLRCESDEVRPSTSSSRKKVKTWVTKLAMRKGVTV